MSKVPALPPTDSSEAVIQWFKDKYTGNDLDGAVKYIAEIMDKRRVHIKDFLQGKSPCGWEVSRQAGANSYDFGFKSDFTPDVLIRMGIFGGLSVRDIETEIPIEWILIGLLEGKIDYKSKFPEQKINYFSVLAEVYPSLDGCDTRGFFQWFCMYYLGKRTEQDEQMIALWRQRQRLFKTVNQSRVTNHILSRQLLLQWSYRT